MFISPDSLPDWISEITLINHLNQTREYHIHCSSWTNWFDVAGTLWSLSEPESLNPSKVPKDFVTPRSTTYLCLLIFGYSQTFLALEISIGHRRLHAEEDWRETHTFLGIVGLSIGAPFLGLIVILRLLTSAKNTIAQLPNSKEATHQQLQKQQTRPWVRSSRLSHYLRQSPNSTIPIAIGRYAFSSAISGSQEPWVALVSPDDLSTIMAMIDLNTDNMES